MSRPATDRLKVNPPLGMMPALQYLPPDMLRVDVSYQRTLDTDASRGLIRTIAQHWNWDLCQPLVVARRGDGSLYVIDGQHRLEAARLRGDIAQLPAVVVSYTSAADEAASFVHLNQQRRPLTKIDLFKAAVASGDAEAVGILAAVHDAGLTIAPHTNVASWKPGMICNIGGIEACWRLRGSSTTRIALTAMAKALDGQVLQYAGTLFPGIAAVVNQTAVDRSGVWFDEHQNRLVALIRKDSQEKWRARVHTLRGAAPNLNFARAAEAVFLEAWDAAGGKGFFTEPDAAPAEPKSAFDWLKSQVTATAPAVKAQPDRGIAAVADWGKVSVAFGRTDADGKRWCDQCDQRRTWAQIDVCRDKHCSFGAKA